MNGPISIRKKYVGRAIRRSEDSGILRGEGGFLADIDLAGALEIHFVRSTEAHATIDRIHLDKALASPGVVAIYTGNDIAFADDHVLCIDMLPTTLDVRQRVLPKDRVRYVGEIIAVVVAEDRYLAEDAADLVRIDYGRLEPVLDTAAATRQGAQLLYPELGTNVVFETTHFDGSPDKAFAEAHLVLAETFDFHRLFAVPLETRGVLATVSPEDGRLLVWSTSQIPQITRGVLSFALGLPKESIRVTAPRLGGGFGCKENIYPEEIIIPKIADMLKRPVRWLEDRREHFISATHAREETVDVQAAVDPDGNITAIRLQCTTDIGSAFAIVTNTVTTMMGAMVRGPYRVPSLDAKMRSVVTNKVPLNVFRGAGHPQGVLVMERLLDIAAERLGIDRAEIRFRNLLRCDELPLDRNESTCLGAKRIIYDEGDYSRCFETAVADFDYASFEKRRSKAAAEGKYLGVGFSNHVEQTAIGPYEDARVRLGLDGQLTVFSPIVPMGQGTEITLRQIAADEIGLPIDAIEIRFGDSDELPDAIGAFASRGAAVGGSAVRQATRALKETVLDRFAEQLNCSRAELVWQDDGIQGPSLTDGPLSLHAVLDQLRTTSAETIEAKFRVENIDATYSYAAHVAEVEIDMDTLKIAVPRYVVAHDCGTVINPLLVEGQIVGGVVQGLGGMLRESLAYDAEGKPTCRCLMDYVLPGISDMPRDLRIHHMETPSSLAQFGVRGVGEGGVTGCYGAIATAVAHALGLAGRRFNSSGPYLPSRLFAERTVLTKVASHDV
jgi:aerobic carbon-monoxide dehydrogenase large subunit